MNKVKVGKIVNTHGIKGELKVAVNDESIFKKGEEIYIYYRSEYKSFKLSDFRMHKNHMLIKIDDLANINDVLQYKECDIFLDREEDDVYLSDIVGYSVLHEGKRVGVVSEIMSNNAHDIIVLDNGKMIPYIDVFIKEENHNTKELIIEVIEGMLDDN